MTAERLILNGGTYQLAELVDDSHNLVGMKATDVTFIGPAVIAFLGGNDFADIRFAHGEGGLESLLWDLGDKKAITGAIGINEGSFTRCTFKGIGVAGDHDTLPRFLRGVMVSAAE